MSVLVCCLVLLCCPWTLQAEGDLEAELKAAYLVNIARFTSWPLREGSIVLCVAKEASIFTEVSQLKGLDFGADLQLSIVVNPDSLAQCNMLYWDQSTAEAASELLSTRHGGLLVVSDLSDAHEQGFAIQFFVRNLKLRFSIDQHVVKRSDYNISSKLLRLSRQID